MFSTDVSIVQAVPQAHGPGGFLLLSFPSEVWPGCVCVCVRVPTLRSRTSRGNWALLPLHSGVLRLPSPPAVGFSLSLSADNSAGRHTSDGSGSLQSSRKPAALGGRSLFLKVCF